MQHTLKYSIKSFDGGMLSTVTYRERVKVADMMAVAESSKGRDGAEGPHLVARMCGLPVSVIEDMDMEDYNDLYAKIMSGKA